MCTVDFHTHVIPEALLDEARTGGGLFGVRLADSVMTHPEGFGYPIEPEYWSASAILERMGATGLDASVLSLAPTLFFYDLPPAEAIMFAHLANDAIAETVRDHASLLALAQLPLQAPEEAAGELRRAVVELGFGGALVGTNVGSTPLDDRSFDVVYAEAERLGAPLFLHPYFVGPKSRLEAYYLTNTIGNPLDTCIAAARLVHGKVLDRFPRLKVVLAHGGGFLPYQLGRLDHAYRVRRELTGAGAEEPSGYRRRFWMDTLTHSDISLAFLAELIGADRLVVGTDLPFDMADARPLERIERVGLDPPALGKVALDLLAVPATA
jgi:aminocarboxymuconate-semialdehyde decarboxylase